MARQESNLLQGSKPYRKGCPGRPPSRGVSALARKLGVSRQRAWQIIKKQQGKCQKCGRGPLETSNHCKIHAEYRRQRDRSR